MQWGMTSIGVAGATVTFPLAYVNSCVVTFGVSGPTGTNPIMTSVSTTGFGFKANAVAQLHWHAIGT
jgi:hypothetical protein